MAFFRLKNIKGKYYTYVVESYREDGKVKQRQKCLGRTSQDDIWSYKHFMFSSKKSKQAARMFMDEYKQKQTSTIEIIPPEKVKTLRDSIESEREEKKSKIARRVLNAILDLALGLQKIPKIQYNIEDKTIVEKQLVWLVKKIQEFMIDDQADSHKKLIIAKKEEVYSN